MRCTQVFFLVLFSVMSCVVLADSGCALDRLYHKSVEGPAPDAEVMHLAKDYVALRWPMQADPGMLTRIQAQAQEKQLNGAITLFLFLYNKALDWNPNNPAWQRAVPILKAQGQNYLAGFAAGHPAENLLTLARSSYVDAIARNLTPADLKALLGYYRSREGQAFMVFQNRLFDEQSKVLAQLSNPAALSALTKTAQSNPPDSPALLKLISFTQEATGTVLAATIAEVGPCGDGTALQAVPMLMGQTIVLGYPAMNAIIQQQSEDRLAAWLDWRSAPLATREREAMSNSVQDAVIALNKSRLLLTEPQILANLDTTWRMTMQKQTSVNPATPMLMMQIPERPAAATLRLDPPASGSARIRLPVGATSPDLEPQEALCLDDVLHTGMTKQEVRQSFQDCLSQDRADQLLEKAELPAEFRIDPVWIFLRADQHVRIIRYNWPFPGAVNGLKTGDHLESLLSKMGQPTVTPFDFAGNQAYVYKQANGSVRYDVDSSGVIRTIFLIAPNPGS